MRAINSGCVCYYTDKRRTGGTVECSLCVAVMQTLETSPPCFNTSLYSSVWEKPHTHTHRPGKSSITFAQCGKLWTWLLTLRRIKSIVPREGGDFHHRNYLQSICGECVQRKCSVISNMLIKSGVKRSFCSVFLMSWGHWHILIEFFLQGFIKNTFNIKKVTVRLYAKMQYVTVGWFLCSSSVSLITFHL